MKITGVDMPATFHLNDDDFSQFTPDPITSESSEADESSCDDTELQEFLMDAFQVPPSS